jgi:hypothetical protein
LKYTDCRRYRDLYSKPDGRENENPERYKSKKYPPH